MTVVTLSPTRSSLVHDDEKDKGLISLPLTPVKLAPAEDDDGFVDSPLNLPLQRLRLESGAGSRSNNSVAVLKTATPGLTTTKMTPDADFVLFADKSEHLAIPVETKDGKLQMEEKPMKVGDVNTAPEYCAVSAVDTVAGAKEVEEKSKANQERDRKSRFVSCKDFDLLKVIGMGAFGKVLQVRNRQTGSILAMKVISKRVLRRKTGYVENVKAERDILTRVRHPFVVTMHCSFQTREKLFIIMDFLAGGELFLRIGREGILLEKTAAFYLAEIILALDHLHMLGILHRDLKPENILLGSDGHVCLTDFGLAKDFGGGFVTEEDDARALTICGTQEYMAPEMLARQGYGRAADYWSLGCIAYEMLSGLPPFQRKRNEGSKDLFRKIMSEKVKMPAGASAEACRLLKGLLNRNVQARLGTARSTMFETGGVASLKAQQFFQSISDWDKLALKQIEPPMNLAVSDETDLRHFHGEFTNMTLPRSVLEMSRDDRLPQRVESDLFRGFSFIQEDFELPQRDEVAVKAYWDAQAEGDGESISDVASSKMDGTEGAIIATLEPEQKKRPPRKRKKKNLKGGAVESTTPRSSAPNTPIPSEDGEEEDLTPAETSKEDEATVKPEIGNTVDRSAEKTETIKVDEKGDQAMVKPEICNAADQPLEKTETIKVDQSSANPNPTAATSSLHVQNTTVVQNITNKVGIANPQHHVTPNIPLQSQSTINNKSTNGSPWRAPSLANVTPAKTLQQPIRSRDDPWKQRSAPPSSDKPHTTRLQQLGAPSPGVGPAPQERWAQKAAAHQGTQPTKSVGVPQPSQTAARQPQAVSWAGRQPVVAQAGVGVRPPPQNPEYSSGATQQTRAWPQGGAKQAPNGAPPILRQTSTDSEPSTDWRQHTMSPRTPRPTRPQGEGAGVLWPSLNDNVPASGTSTTPVNMMAAPQASIAPPPPPPPNLKGAWASRTKL